MRIIASSPCGSPPAPDQVLAVYVGKLPSPLDSAAVHLFSRSVIRLYVTSDRRNVLLLLCTLRSCSLGGLWRLRSRASHLIDLLLVLNLTVAAFHLFHPTLNLQLSSLD